MLRLVVVVLSLLLWASVALAWEPVIVAQGVVVKHDKDCGMLQVVVSRVHAVGTNDNQKSVSFSCHKNGRPTGKEMALAAGMKIPLAWNYQKGSFWKKWPGGEDGKPRAQLLARETGWDAKCGSEVIPLYYVFELDGERAQSLAVTKPKKADAKKQQRGSHKPEPKTSKGKTETAIECPKTKVPPPIGRTVRLVFSWDKDLWSSAQKIQPFPASW